MTPTQKQIQERLHKMRDEEKNLIILRLVAVLEFYGDERNWIKYGRYCSQIVADAGYKARLLIEELEWE